LEKAGIIKDLKRQVKHKIPVNGEVVCSYVSDAEYLVMETGIKIVEDTKSEATRKIPVYRLKKKLMWAVLRIKITEV
jgi:hypothetical protein